MCSTTFLHNLIEVFRIEEGNRVLNGAIGYEAALSAYSPGLSLYSTPLLPQSALLNSLPLKDTLIGQLQAYLESFIQLISPSAIQELQLSRNNSVLWTNLCINSQRAAGILIYNRQNHCLTMMLKVWTKSTDVSD